MKKFGWMFLIGLLLSSCKKDAFEPGFSYKIVEGVLTTAVSFEIIGDDIQFANWDFGDGASSSQLNPTHEYRNISGQPKEYLVKLVVKNENGNRKEVRQKITIATNAAGTATLTLTVRDELGNPVADALVTFHDEKESWMNKTNALFDPLTTDANGKVSINFLPEKVIYYNVEKEERNNRFSRTFNTIDALKNDQLYEKEVLVRPIATNEVLFSRSLTGVTPKKWLITKLELAENLPDFHYPVRTDMYDDGRWIDSNERYGLWWFEDDGTIIYDYFSSGGIVESTIIELTDQKFVADINFFGISIKTYMKVIE